jgi:hypothetical protein
MSFVVDPHDPNPSCFVLASINPSISSPMMAAPMVEPSCAIFSESRRIDGHE